VVKRFCEMALVKLKIDVSGTVGDEAWRKLRQFDEIQSADFGPQFGTADAAITRSTRRTEKGNGSAPKSGCRRLFWRNTPSRIISNRIECWMRM